MTSDDVVNERHVSSHADGLFNPRLSDVFGLVVRQDQVDFVVPHLRDDLPLSVDPFLLWKSSRTEYEELHRMLLGFVEQVRMHALAGRIGAGHRLLAEVREPVELGLGYATGTKRGSAIGPMLSAAIIDTFRQVPQLRTLGWTT